MLGVLLCIADFSLTGYFILPILVCNICVDLCAVILD